MSCIVTYNNEQMSQEEFDDKYIPTQGEIIEYDGAEYMVHFSNKSGTQLLRGESLLAVYEDGDQAAYERTSLLDSIPIYNLDPVQSESIYNLNADGTLDQEMDSAPIFDVPLTVLLQNGFEKTGRTFDFEKYKNAFGNAPSDNDLAFQLRDESNVESSIKELDNYLLDFMKPFGVRSKEFDELKSKLGVDALGATDVLNKLIWYTKNRNAETIPEEVGHMATMLMGENHPDIKDLLSEIENWSEYKEIYSQYMPIYNNEKQVKIEAIGKLIAKSLVNNYKASGFDKTLLQKALDAITKFINNMLTTTNVGDALQYTSKIADHIALNILIGNKDYIANLKPSTEKLNYKKALEGNPFAQKIINFFTNKKMKLTGSIAIAGQGETVYRSSAEPIHDIDFNSNSFDDFANIQEDLLKMNAEPYHYGWDNKQKDYKTFAFIIPKEGFTIQVLARDFERGNGWITSYNVLNSKGQIVEPTSQNHLAVDFFVYKNGQTANNNSIFKSFADIFFGKLTLSSEGNNERMFKREKDQADYVLSFPKTVATTDKAFRYLQTEEMPASKASEETVNKIKELAKQAGINIQDLVDYAKANPNVNVKNINGLADIVKGIIAIAQGREGTTITEEYVHIASAIVEKTNPELITALISKINRFKIYNQTLEAYKNNKAYQLPNGKPDIRKIKKEAVDKLISELIVKQSEGSTEFPELLEEETRSMLREWWDAILDVIKGIYTKSNIDLFETAAEKIGSGELGGTVSDITEEGGVFFQQRKSNPVIDAAYNLQKDIHDRMILIPEVKDAEGNITTKRHYEIDGEIVEESVTEKHQSTKQFKPKTALEIKNNEIKMKFGIDGHDFIENEIKLNLIDSEGYAKENFTNDVIDTDLPTSIQLALRSFARELIRSYEPGTRFLVETMVVNEQVKGKLGSTVDFKAFEPVERNGKPDMKVDTLDWKFSSLGTDKDDVAWWNVEKWPLQMGEYIKMDRNLGITTQQTGKARMVPFVPLFEYATPGVPSSGLVIKSLEVGNVDPKKEKKLYLVPVPIATETTGSKKVDALVTAFRNQYDKLRISSFGKSTDEKNEFLNQLSKAIRQLQVQLNFEPLATIGQQFLNNSARALKAFETIDYTSLSADDIQAKLGELLQFKDSAIKFATIDEDFVSIYNKRDLDEQGKKTLELLTNISNRTGGMLKLIAQLERDYTIHLALKSNVITEEDDPNILKNKVDNFLKAEIEINGLAKTFMEGTKLSNRIINLASNLILKAKSLSAITIGKAIDSFGPLVIKLDAEAKRLGKTGFEMIGEVRDSKLKLIKKLDQRFYDERTKAIELENKEFFLDNMNLDEYKKLAEEKIKSKTEIIKNNLHFIDEKQNELEIQKKIKILNDSLNINDDSFNGYDTFDFKQLFMKSLKEENFYSDKFKELQKSDAALQVWNTFTDWNRRAYEMGYLDEEGLSFFPLMEATLIQKLSNNSDIAGEGKDFFDSLYKVRVNEESQYSKLDPETRKLKKIIPKYFTRTDRAAHQLSTDLTKVGALYMKSLIEYQTARNLENTLLILHSVEQSRGTIVTDESGIVFEGGDPVVDETAHKSADILMTIADDALYGHAEDLNSLGNSIVSSTINRTGGTQEEKANREVNLKKALQTSNIFIRALAVGLKPLLAASNYFGFNFQAYINAGNLYRYDKDFRGDHGRIISGNLSVVEKALMHYISGLNEDVAEERIRSISRKQSLPKWLGTWTFSDAMMVTNSIPEKALGLTNVLSMLKNSIVVDGKIVNIRQYLKQQDRKLGKYKLSETERTALEKSFEERVLELKNSDKTLISIAKIENDELIIPGITDEELAELRVKIIENGRKLNGQMNRDDKAGFARDTIFRSFMMFKTWIPKQIIVRGMNLKRSNELNEWELGRTRAFINVWSHLGTKRIFEMSEIINGSEKGLAIMDAILKEKKQDYFRRTGQALEISQEEFYDLMRQELTNQMKELKLLFGLMTLVLAVGAAQPPEDADPLTKNHYKYLMKATHKISDELSFYYNPVSFESMTKGSILPQLGLATKVITLLDALRKETYATITGDDKTADKTYPLKYAFNIIPLAYQFQTDILPLVYPEGAKKMGVRVSPQARQ